MHSVDEHKDRTTDRRERRIGAALLVLGLLVAGGALVKIQREEAHQAQAAQQTPAPSDQDSSKPAPAEPGGTRPTTPAPEPAQPQVKPGETTGAAPLTTQDRPPETGKPLPQAPAEKMAPPIGEK